MTAAVTLSARAATLFVQIDEPPLQPVASQLTLGQRLDPPTAARAGEPVIRTLTLTLEGWQPPQSGTPARLTRPARRHQGQAGWGAAAGALSCQGDAAF